MAFSPSQGSFRVASSHRMTPKENTSLFSSVCKHTDKGTSGVKWVHGLQALRSSSEWDPQLQPASSASCLDWVLRDEGRPSQGGTPRTHTCTHRTHAHTHAHAHIHTPGRASDVPDIWQRRTHTYTQRARHERAHLLVAQYLGRHPLWGARTAAWGLGHCGVGHAAQT